MHELSICQSMLKQVSVIAREHQASSVMQITLRVGPLSGVEPKLLQSAFPLASAGTIADEATLLIESLPIRVQCRSCGQQSEVSPNRLTCHHCGDYKTQLISGDELLLANVELTTDSPPGKPGSLLH